MRNRLIVLATATVFALGVAAVALSGGGGGPLEKLPVAAQAADEASGAGRSASSLEFPAFGPVEYRVAGTLPDLASTAPAFRLRASASASDVARLARVLGIDGPVKELAERFEVRADGRLLSVERQPGMPWNASPDCGGSISSEPVFGCAKPGFDVVESVPTEIAPDAGGGSPGSVGGSKPCPPDAMCILPVPVPDRCVPRTTCTEPVPGPSPEPGPVPEPVRPADLPSEAGATAIARALFVELGLGLDGFEVSDGFNVWQASVRSRVGGLPTLGLGAFVAVGPKGRVEYANGWLAAPERLGDYALVGPKVGLERLRAGVGEGIRPLLSDDAVEPAVDDVAGVPSTATEGPDGPVPPDCSAPTVICDPPPGATSEPVVETITGVHLALQQVDDRLVPVYVFELQGGGETYPVPAVVDDLLARPAVAAKPEPQPEPATRPRG